jgi:hypothetical protein
LALVAAGPGFTNLAAQGLLPGQRVRLTLGQPTPTRFVATLEGSSADSIAVRIDNVSRIVARASVTRIDVSQGKRGRAVTGMAVGLIAGAGLAAAAIAAAHVDCGGQDEGGWCTRAPLLGGATFGLVGLGIGALIRTERWKEIPDPTHGGIKGLLGFALGFRF